MSPRNFVVTAPIAALFWIGVVSLWRMRAAIMIVQGWKRTGGATSPRS